MSRPPDLSEDYWNRLSENDRALYLIVKPHPKAAYTVDIGFGDLENFLAGQQRDLIKLGGSLELEPDFQRGHVWTDEQRRLYVEAVLRDMAPNKIIFNCPGWMNTEGSDGDIPAFTLQCVDGLQRITAVRKFLAEEFAVFDGIKASGLKGSPFDTRRYRFNLCIHEFSKRADLLDFYLRLNDGGTVHSKEELDRVRGLLRSSLEESEPIERPTPSA